jgi:hypothetical protein
MVVATVAERLRCFSLFLSRMTASYQDLYRAGNLMTQTCYVLTVLQGLEMLRMYIQYQLAPLEKGHLVQRRRRTRHGLWRPPASAAAWRHCRGNARAHSAACPSQSCPERPRGPQQRVPPHVACPMVVPGVTCSRCVPAFRSPIFDARRR